MYVLYLNFINALYSVIQTHQKALKFSFSNLYIVQILGGEPLTPPSLGINPYTSDKTMTAEVPRKNMYTTWKWYKFSWLLSMCFTMVSFQTVLRFKCRGFTFTSSCYAINHYVQFWCQAGGFTFPALAANPVMQASSSMTLLSYSGDTSWWYFSPFKTFFYSLFGLGFMPATTFPKQLQTRCN